MITLYLKRVVESQYSTFGVLHDNIEIICLTIELPDKDNTPFISCIPTGPYVCERDYTGKHKYFKVLDVDGRTNIEIHPAQTAEQLEGCIGLGLMPGKYKDKPAILLNTDAMQKLMAYIGAEEKFALVIQNAMDII